MIESKPTKLIKLGNQSINYLPFDKYVLRTPYLAFEEIKDLNIDSLKNLCSKPEIAEAIFLASPELHQEMLKYLNKKHEDSDDKIAFALLKYLLRMGSRCTPFGLFSGCSVGKIENETSIALKKQPDFKRVTRLDMQYLCALSQKLELNKEVRSELKYYPNTSLYQIGDEIRYVEYQFISTIKKHFLMSIEDNDFIYEIINKSKNGVTIVELATSIIDSEISMDDAVNFVHELIDNQILISSISPAVSGKDYFEILRDEIKSEPIKIWLNKINDKIKKLDTGEYEVNLQLYKEIADLANSFDIEVDKKHLFQTDLKITCFENKIDASIIENVKEAINILCKIAPRKEGEKKLKHFKKKFYERYEEEEIPLIYALDVESGIGFGEEFESTESYFFSEFTDDISNSTLNQNSDQVSKIEQTEFSKILLTRLLNCYSTKEKILELKEEDLKDIKDNWHLVPNSFSTIVRILEVNDKVPLLYLTGFGGGTASFIMNRFGSVDCDIYDFVQEIYNVEELYSKENREDVIYAEIVHLPESRTGNIIYRNNLRGYEIPYLAKSTLPAGQQIMITDLYISIRNERIFLRSKSLNKEVIPILSNAHNLAADPLPIYGFLTSMMYQGKREFFGFKWGDFVVEENYLPRVVYKNIILSFATWNIYESELKTLNTIDDLKLFLKKREIPNKVQIEEYDNRLLVNFENELSCRMFLSMIKTKNYILLKEYLFNEDKSIVKQGNQGMENEIVVSFYKEN